MRVLAHIDSASIGEDQSTTSSGCELVEQTVANSWSSWCAWL